MTMVEERMRRIAEGVAAGFGASASLDFRPLFPPLVNHADEAGFIADCAADIVGEENVNRHGPVTMASEDFSYMLERVPGAYIQIGNGDGAGACEVHNPVTISTIWLCRSAPRCSPASSNGGWRVSDDDEAGAA